MIVPAGVLSEARATDTGPVTTVPVLPPVFVCEPVVGAHTSVCA